MRIGAVTLAFNDEGTIAGTIKCLQGKVDKHIVLISEKPYYGQDVEPDRTEEICEDLGVDIIKGYWELDHFQRNLGNKMCSDCDWVLGFDSDEMVTDEEFKHLKSFLETTDKKAVSVRPEVYWKTTDYILDPKPEYAPVIAMRPDVRFTYIRNVDAECDLWTGTMHHLSWCAPKDILKKVRHYAHADEFNADEWYKQHYENWKPGEPVIFPDSKYQAIERHLPEELKCNLR